MPLINIVDADFLNSDRELLHAVGGCCSVREVDRVLRTMHYYYSSTWMLRKRYGLRISARKVLRIARPLLPRD